MKYIYLSLLFCTNGIVAMQSSHNQVIQILADSILTQPKKEGETRVQPRLFKMFLEYEPMRHLGFNRFQIDVEERIRYIIDPSSKHISCYNLVKEASPK